MDDDRINDLPDAIICHILSFLPTKQAVATSVLSQRWMPLWRSVLTLDFDETEDGVYRFIESVYAIILSRDLHQPIQTFRLHCRHLDPATTSVCVNAAIQRRVQHLDLSFWHFKPLTNLASIFSCTTLVVLRLQWLYLKPLSSVDLPFLKVLHLQDLLFSEHESLAELLCGCPNLEDLKVKGIRFRNYATRRELKTLAKLVRANISARLLFTEAVNNVEFLHLDEIYWTDCGILPMFLNLIHVELSSNQYYDLDWSPIVELLKHCPKLQVLVINQASKQSENIGDCHFPPSIPECILLRLKRCYLNGYRGSKAEFKFAKYILRNGNFLKKMMISSSIAEDQKSKMLKQLSSCKRRSANCILSFE